MITSRLRQAWLALIGLLGLAVAARVVVWLLTPLVPILLAFVGLGLVGSLVVSGPRYWQPGGKR